MKTIEITTTQNVTIEYELASLRDRFIGVMVDFAIVLFGYLAFLIVLRMTFGNGILNAIPAHVWVMILPLSLFFLYNIVLEMFLNGQTIGKRSVGTKVVRLDGREPEWSDVLLRSVLHLADSIFCFGAIGSLLIKTTSSSQRLGDMAAHTTVIKIMGSGAYYRLHDILNIQTVQNYQPVYPQVRNLQESDLIFIKTVLSRVQKNPNHAHEGVVEDLVTHLMPILKIATRPNNRVEFLKTLLRDYIVLTR